MQRQVLYVDSIIALSRSLFLEFANGLDPDDERTPDLARSYAMAISDVLEKIGVPRIGIVMALGDAATFSSGLDYGGTIPCFFCGKPATSILEIQDEYRTVCLDHYFEFRPHLALKKRVA